MIRASRLTKDYGPNRAVDDVSFNVAKGDIAGLLGPNGSGKTTIIRMLTGFFSPTAGSCMIGGIDLAEEPLAARKQIGYLPERVALYPDMSVKAYLRFAAKVRGIERDTVSHVNDAVDKCGLRDVYTKHIGKLSRGFRQRVGIAQAIVHRPVVLILDEPTVGLDPRQIVEIRSLISDLAGEATVLLSTHILPEVSIVCRSVLILDHGRLIAEDTAEGLSEKTAGRGETLLKVRVADGDRTDLERAVGSCEGVDGVDVDYYDTAGMASVIIRSAPDCDVRPQLARMVIEKGWALDELSPRLMSLEELFVKILDDAGHAA